MVNTLQVDGLVRITGQRWHPLRRILNHRTASPHALYDVLVLDAGRGKTMSDLVDRDRELPFNLVTLNKTRPRTGFGGIVDTPSSYFEQNKHSQYSQQVGYGSVPGWCLQNRYDGSTGQFGYGGVPGCCVDPACGYQVLSSFMCHKFHAKHTSKPCNLDQCSKLGVCVCVCVALFC